MAASVRGPRPQSPLLRIEAPACGLGGCGLGFRFEGNHLPIRHLCRERKFCPQRPRAKKRLGRRPLSAETGRPARDLRKCPPKRSISRRRRFWRFERTAWWRKQSDANRSLERLRELTGQNCKFRHFPALARAKNSVVKALLKRIPARAQREFLTSSTAKPDWHARILQSKDAMWSACRRPFSAFIHLIICHEVIFFRCLRRVTMMRHGPLRRPVVNGEPAWAGAILKVPTTLHGQIAWFSVLPELRFFLWRAP